MADTDPGSRLPVARNAAWLMVGEVASKVASLVFVVVVARAVGVREYGWFTFATAFAPLLLAVGGLGLGVAVLREMVADRAAAPRAFASELAVRLSTGGVGVVAATLLTPLLMAEPGAAATVAVVGVALLLDLVTSSASVWWQAYGDLRPYARALVINRVASTALAVLAYAVGTGLPGILATYVVGSLLATGYVLRAVRREFGPWRLRDADRVTAARLVRVGAPLGVASVLNMALLRAGTLVVAAVLGPVAVGLYGVAFRFYESFLFVAFSLGEATLPRFAGHGPSPQSRRALETTLVVCAAAYTPLFVLSLPAAEAVVVTVFGSPYAEAAEAVPWLTLAALLFAVTYQLRMAAIARHGGAPVMWTAASALGLNTVLALVLVPRTGIEGAGMSTAAAAALECVLTASAAHRRGYRWRPRVLLPAALAGAATGLLVSTTGLSGWPALLVGAAGYLVVLVLLGRLLPPDQRAWLRAKGSALLRR